MELPIHKKEFLIKYHRRLLERAFLIDIMTQVGGRPVFPLYESEAITPDRRSVRITLSTPPDDAAYIPMNEQDTEEDEILKQVVIRQIALVYPFDNSLFNLLFQYRNYLALSPEKKEQADSFFCRTGGYQCPDSGRCGRYYQTCDAKGLLFAARGRI